MKNFKKKLSFLLAAVPMLSNAGMTKAQAANDVAQTQMGDKGKSANSNSMKSPVDLSRYLSDTLSRDEQKIREDIAKDLVERISSVRNTSLELMSDMTGDDFATNSNEEYTEMISTIEKIQTESGALSSSMTNIHRELKTSPRSKIDKMLEELDVKVKGLEKVVYYTRDSAWPELKKNITDYTQRTIKSNELQKKTLIKSCAGQCQRTRKLINNLENSLQMAINTDPTMEAMYAHIREGAHEIIIALNRLESQLANATSLNIQSLQAMKENSQLREVRATKLLGEFGDIQARAASDSYTNTLAEMEANIVKTEMSCFNRTQMNLSRRIMTDSQRSGLLQIKEELKKLFDNVKNEIYAVRTQAGANRSLSKAIPFDIRQRLETSISETLGEVADYMRSWNKIIHAIEKDDELRAQWNVAEMHRIMVQRMTQNCYEILTNASWNINKKTVSIVNEINNVQPGTGTMVQPIIRGVLEYLTKGTPLTSLGEAVAGNLSGRSWLITGEGGTGKSSAVELIAAAFNVKLVKINGADLRSSGKIGRIIRDLRALTQPQANPNNIVNFMVLIDEVDTGVCVATDSKGRSLELEGEDIEQSSVSPGTRRKLSDIKGNSDGRAKWKLKTARSKDTGDVVKKKTSTMDMVMARNPEGFRGLSAIYNLLDGNTQSNMWGLFSTSNFSRQSMPEEVARRLSPGTHEIIFRKPTKQEFIDIINKRMPNLSFSDGYDKTEGAAKIAEQAEKYELSAAELLSTVTPIANAVRKPEESSCSLPATGLCKLISGSITEGQLIEEARMMNLEEKTTSAGSETSNGISTEEFDMDGSSTQNPSVEGMYAPGVRLNPLKN